MTASSLARPGVGAPQADSRRVTLTGKVVDAACFMIHPPAASIPSHQDCGAACLARGVPLAIANEQDGALYFPADGNRQLSTILNQRVRVIGTVVRNSQPMELKMDVGESNQMAVRVDGGYNVVTIDTLEKVPAQPKP
jgi:hypothetical protein